MSGQKRFEVLTHADRAYSRAAAAMGNAKCFVQVQMRHVSAEFSGRSTTDQCIQVGAVQVNLPAVLVHDGGL